MLNLVWEDEILPILVAENVFFEIGARLLEENEELFEVGEQKIPSHLADIMGVSDSGKIEAAAMLEAEEDGLGNDKLIDDIANSTPSAAIPGSKDNGPI